VYAAAKGFGFAFGSFSLGDINTMAGVNASFFRSMALPKHATEVWRKLDGFYPNVPGGGRALVGAKIREVDEAQREVRRGLSDKIITMAAESREAQVQLRELAAQNQRLEAHASAVERRNEQFRKERTEKQQRLLHNTRRRQLEIGEIMSEISELGRDSLSGRDIDELHHWELDLWLTGLYHVNANTLRREGLANKRIRLHEHYDQEEQVQGQPQMEDFLQQNDIALRTAVPADFDGMQVTHAAGVVAVAVEVDEVV
jgi:signal transduction histidine kinase